MIVTLTAADQYGLDGPKPGDKFDVFDYAKDPDGDFFFFGRWIDHPEVGYFIFSPEQVEAG